jgi:hypothetical protein
LQYFDFFSNKFHNSREELAATFFWLNALLIFDSSIHFASQGSDLTDATTLTTQYLELSKLCGAFGQKKVAAITTWNYEICPRKSQNIAINVA